MPRRSPVELDPAEPARLLEELPVGVALVVRPGTIAWANAAYRRITGRGEGLVGADFHAITEVEGTWSPAVRAAVDEALRSGAPADFRAVRAFYRREVGGVYLDLKVRAVGKRTGPPGGAMLVVEEVTDRVVEERRARLFHEAFRTSTNPMQLTDADGTMLDVNPAYERVYGYSRAECVGRKPNLVRSRHTPPELYQKMWADLKDPLRGFWSGEILNRDRSGRERPVLLSITAIRTLEGEVTHYLGVAVDLSEQRAWELRAAHSDKLASVGQLAAGVAHEINTPLANLMLVAESLRRRSRDPWVIARADTLSDQIEVAARIVRGLLDFARREEPRAGDLDLASPLREAVGFLRGKQSADVEIVEVYPDDPVPVTADRGQLIQVFTNILNNAYDAMAGRGTIRVSLRRHGERAEVDIVDSGPGIPLDALSHVFEPFFTTKPEGVGTGLGLAICHGIVQSHHGSITARNVPGAGAGFLLSLPIRTPHPARGAGARGPTAGRPPSGKG